MLKLALLLIPLYFASSLKTEDGRASRQKCDSKVFCHGPILSAIQSANLFADSKHFVDMVGKYPEETICKRFDGMGKNPSKVKMMRFVVDNFHRPGKDLRPKIPKDWVQNPAFLSKIHNPNLKKFAKDLHFTWKALVRQTSHKGVCNGCPSSLLSLPYPFIVPGGRFRELYYWDSYWIMEGLYVSGMCQTALYQISNFKYLVDKLGFIPNGSRQYYLNRSHPPKFITMVARYIDSCVPASEKKTFLQDFLPSMEKEYEFWQKHRTVMLSDPKYPGKVFKLNRFAADTEQPRPESYMQDTRLASIANFDELKSRFLYKHLSSGAESGWDFSSRWFKDPPFNISSIETADIIPVDLNTLLYKNEKTLAELHLFLNNEAEARRFQSLAAERLEAINNFLWSDKEKCWIDYNYVRGSPISSNHTFYVSNLSPIWHHVYDPDNFSIELVEQALLKHGKLLFEFPGGIPIGYVPSNEQWDFPNVWAPIQHLFIETFERIHEQKTGDQFWRLRAIELAKKMVKNALPRLGQFFEKYHATRVGHPGVGGEYIVQDGFGWTNGVLLWIIEKYGDEVAFDPKDCPQANEVFQSQEPVEITDKERLSFFEEEDRKVRRQSGPYIAFIVLFILLILIILHAYHMYNRQRSGYTIHYPSSDHIGESTMLAPI